MAIQTPRVFALKQPAAAIAKDFVCYTGWRPSMIIAFSGELGMWMKVDGLSEHADDKVLILPDGSGNADIDAGDFCTLLDYGFRLEGNTTWIRANDLQLVLIAFPPGVDGPFAANLGDDNIRTLANDAFGIRDPRDKGDAVTGPFAPTPQDEDPLYWIRREA